MGVLSVRAIVGALLVLSCLAGSLRAQQETPEVLRNAAHCLVEKRFLPSSNDRKLQLASILDTESYPGEQALYVVSYPKSGRSKGLVFTVFLQQHDGQQAFDVQNNAGFVRTRDPREPVNFVNPPLGGTWTQQHLVAAIVRIEAQPTFTIDVNDLRSASVAVACESYADLK
jgi:hypothetical protein